MSVRGLGTTDITDVVERADDIDDLAEAIVAYQRARETGEHIRSLRPQVRSLWREALYGIDRLPIAVCRDCHRLLHEDPAPVVSASTFSGSADAEGDGEEHAERYGHCVDVLRPSGAVLVHDGEMLT